MAEAEYEVVINGEPFNTIDPIYEIKIVIDNGAHVYSYGPEELRTLEVRRRVPA